MILTLLACMESCGFTEDLDLTYKGICCPAHDITLSVPVDTP